MSSGDVTDNNCDEINYLSIETLCQFSPTVNQYPEYNVRPTPKQKCIFNPCFYMFDISFKHFNKYLAGQHLILNEIRAITQVPLPFEIAAMNLGYATQIKSYKNK